MQSNWRQDASREVLFLDAKSLVFGSYGPPIDLLTLTSKQLVTRVQTLHLCKAAGCDGDPTLHKCKPIHSEQAATAVL
jgi:hypothetical protein